MISHLHYQEETRGENTRAATPAHTHALRRSRLMGYELRRWLADHLPAGLSSGERLVALEIADQANDQTRRAYGRVVRATILRRTGYADEKQLGKVLTKLGKNGVEMRVPVSDKDGEPVRDKRGRVVYACHGHEVSEFLVPLLADLPSCPDRGSLPDEADPDRSPDRGSIDDEGAPLGPDAAPPGPGSCPAGGSMVPPAGHPSPQSPQEPSSLSGPERTIADATGATPEETREIISLIRRDNNPRSLAPYVRTLANNGDLPELLARVRAEARQRAARRNPPPPPPMAEPDQPTVTPEERDAAVAAARALLQNARAQTRRGDGGPRRFTPTPRPDVEPPPDVQAAHAFLLNRGDASDWLEAARTKLGTEAERGDVLVLAAQLART